ncbi:MAG: UxaA family hydrolase [Comamonas sp.]
MNQTQALWVDPRDHMATAFVALKAGSTISLNAHSIQLNVTLQDHIPAGHKFAITAIAQGSEVLKYGACIGRALSAISAGSHIHIHNLESLRGRGDQA